MTKAKTTAASPKKSKAFVQTPEGTATFTHLYEADKEYGKFQVTIQMDRAEAEEAFAAQIEALDETLEQFKVDNPRKAKSVRLRSLLKDTDDDSIVELKATSQFQPPVFDTKGKPVDPYPKIGGGSKMFLMVEIAEPKYAGARDEISSAVYLNAVQLLSLVHYGKGSGSGASPFGATNAGSYVAPDEPEEDEGIDDEIPTFKPAKSSSVRAKAPIEDDATDY